MPFPSQRLRRLRLNSQIRERLTETELSPHRLIMPFFVRSGRGIKTPIRAMPGQYQRSLDILLRDVAALRLRGLKSVLLFGTARAQRCARNRGVRPTRHYPAKPAASKSSSPIFWSLPICVFASIRRMGIAAFLNASEEVRR